MLLVINPSVLLGVGVPVLVSNCTVCFKRRGRGLARFHHMNDINVCQRKQRGEGIQENVYLFIVNSEL